MRRRSLGGLALALLAGLARAEMSTLEAARVERLIQYVAGQQQLQFVRNGTAYSCKDAALFLRGKLDKMGGHVTTAAQFIEQIASRSSTSGQAYLIRYPDGHTLPAAQFLGDELRRIDRQP